MSQSPIARAIASRPHSNAEKAGNADLQADLAREKRKWEAETFKVQEQLFYDAVDEKSLVEAVCVARVRQFCRWDAFVP